MTQQDIDKQALLLNIPRANNYGVPQSVLEGLMKLIFCWAIPLLIGIWLLDIFGNGNVITFDIYKNLILTIVLSLGIFGLSVSSRGMAMEEDKRLKIMSGEDKLNAVLKVMSNTDIRFADRKAMLEAEFNGWQLCCLNNEIYCDALQNLKRADWEK